MRRIMLVIYHEPKQEVIDIKKLKQLTRPDFKCDCNRTTNRNDMDYSPYTEPKNDLILKKV